jgi:hypothetical protein
MASLRSSRGLGSLLQQVSRRPLVAGGAVRCLATVHGKREKEKRKESAKNVNFWRKWDRRTTQAFWQDVAFDADRTHERRIKTRDVAKTARQHSVQEVESELDEKDEYDDVYFGLPGADSEVDEFEEYYDDEELDGEADPERGRTRRSSRSPVGDISGEMYSDSSLGSRRRAELLEMLNDFGGTESLQVTHLSGSVLMVRAVGVSLDYFRAHCRADRFQLGDPS